jgi:DNA (cytosine-5)-methyltransferase 1
VVTLTVGSTFSGIEGFGAGFERVGMQVGWQCESDEKCRELLGGRWPGVPIYDDVRTVHGQGWCEGGKGFPDARCDRCLPRIDVLCGGFPCQDVSVAGRRAGLAGERSGLFWEFARLAAQLAPRWLVIENVPGLLSSCGCDECSGNDGGPAALGDDGDDDGIAPAASVDHRGRDMAVVVGTLTELGYGVAWRVLDAQYFGLAQRRERVFLVGCLGDPARAASVLLEPESCGGNSASRREAGTVVTQSLTGGASSSSCGNPDDNRAQGNFVVAVPVVPALSGRQCSGQSRDDGDSETFVPELAAALSTANGVTSNSGGRRQEDDVNLVADTLRSHPRPGSNSNGALVVEGAAAVASLALRGRGDGAQLELGEEGVSNALRTGGGGARQGWAVRRLTPLECERLQGFPDGWTDGFPDSVRYRMLGNAAPVPVTAWIGKRIVAASTA